MKTLDQVFRYTRECKFTEDDWQQVLSYCRSHYKGGAIHIAKRAKIQSTYQQFLDWVENGYGAGDIVGYGNTMGVVQSATPAGMTLAAYCDFEGNLINQPMKVLHPERIKPLNEDQKTLFKKMMYENGLEFYVRSAMIDGVYTPKKNYYVLYNDGQSTSPKVAMYLETVDNKYHFAALLDGKQIKIDCWADTNYTPLKQASVVDIRRLMMAASKKGWRYNERLQCFVRADKRGRGNMYWYLTDRFEIAKDIDDGTQKHKDRYDAGNYFIDYTAAILFMQEVQKIRRKI